MDSTTKTAPSERYPSLVLPWTLWSIAVGILAVQLAKTAMAMLG